MADAGGLSAHIAIVDRERFIGQMLMLRAANALGFTMPARARAEWIECVK